MGKVIGIDLGTTFSAAAIVNEHGKPEILPNSDSDRLTPSVVLFDDDVTVVGKTAKQQSVAVPEQVVDFVKRRMGQPADVYFRKFHGKNYSADEISAIILKKVKQDAEARLGEPVTDAVITVPAYFGDAERAATKNAGSIAGLNVLQLVNEPTAAAIAYGIDRLGQDQNVFVFDLGGGTFDVTLMEISGSTFRMLQTNGDHRLGGKDWDDLIAVHVASRFEAEHGVNPLNDGHAAQELQLNATSAKEVLSKRAKTWIVCGLEGKTTRVELTREEFEALARPKVEKCKQLCEVVLNDARLTWQDIGTVLLVGGSTRMPMIQNMLADLTGKSLNPQELNPDEAVALGAALHGTLRQIRDQPASAQPLAAALTQRYGSADVEIIDGATHSLGVIVHRGGAEGKRVNHVMIDKMEPIPCTKTDGGFGVHAANQECVVLRVVQGLAHGRAEDRGLKFDTYAIGECVLELPPGTPRGAQVIITYKYNHDQTLEVEAVGPDGRVAKISINRGTLDADAVTSATSALQRLSVE